MKRRGRILLLAGMLLCTACKTADTQMPESTTVEMSALPGEGTQESSVEETSATGKAKETEAAAESEAATFAETQELTMESLIQLCSDGGSIRFIQEQGLGGFTKYENIKPDEDMPQESLTGMYACTLPWQDREYHLQVYFWKPGTASEYGHAEYEIDSVRLAETRTGDAVLLYSEDSRYNTIMDVSSFLNREYGLDQYMTVKLPDGFALGEYQADMAGFAGSLLVGDVEEAQHGDGAPESWYSPGGIGILSPESCFVFENGELTDILWYSNHSAMLSAPEKLEGCETQALICEFNFDLFTASEIGTLEEAGTELSTEDHTSTFWYVFMGNEDMENGYVVFLNEQYFTKDDTIELARSVHLLE